MQPGMPRLSEKHRAVQTLIIRLADIIIIRTVISRTLALSREQSWRHGFFITLYLALVYLKPLPVLGLALLLPNTKLPDVMAPDH